MNKFAIDDLSVGAAPGAGKGKKDDVDVLTLDANKEWSRALRGSPRDVSFVSFQLHASASSIVDIGRARLGLTLSPVSGSLQLMFDDSATGTLQWKTLNFHLGTGKHGGKNLAALPTLTVRLDPGTSTWDLTRSAPYFRRVQANRKEPVYVFFKHHNPQMTETSIYNPNTDAVICFPVEAPPNAILREDLTAVQFLELVKLVQTSWVVPGGDPSSRSPQLHHNVSNTCSVQNSEWEDVGGFIWGNREFFTGISLLHEAGDKVFAQAPREEVSGEVDVAKWNLLRPQPVDYAAMHEETDTTDLKQTVACAGGACEIV